MAKYTVTYHCGHEGTVNLYGKSKEREKTLAYLQTLPCPDCERKAASAAHEVENRKAMEFAKEQNLPTLVGSEKQVPWATTIRQVMIQSVEDANNPSDLMRDGLSYVTQYRKAKNLPVITDRDWAEEMYEEGKANFLLYLKTETKASYFIRVRNRLAKEFGIYLIIAFYKETMAKAKTMVDHML